ncbi:MAG: CDP-glucose 4,6-dehydratase [Candidatus Rickettsiella isopodorum]|jgi:CDP-glucose 4,6-dehydratase|nr:CDP-glucose 4,6-dehydratase [Candidatus Rickettsiella isopodorum]
MTDTTMKFWNGKNVLITGHTGFKGTWLSLWLQSLGANCVGFSLEPPTKPNLFDSVQLCKSMMSIIGDIRDFELVQRVLKKHQPEIIIHMAAQPLVNFSYQEPLMTYSTNIIGTTNLLEAARFTDSIKAIVNVTSDKCYQNQELDRGYHEEDSLGGYDPYSSSKACSELVTQAYSYSYLKNKEINIATARAGNVIGGGDWGQNRLVPDVVKACIKQKNIFLRYPNALRPWQHVLEPLYGYLTLAKQLFESPPSFTQAWNFGPNEEQDRTVSWLTDALIKHWESGIKWIQNTSEQPYETSLLRLNSTKAKEFLAWKSQWPIETAIVKTIEWYKNYLKEKNMQEITLAQIDEFQKNFV